MAAASAGPPTPGNFDGPAELPRILMETAMHDTPTPGKVIRVPGGEDASEAVEKASCGDTVQLQAGATFRRLVLPEKNCDDSHWIIVRTSAPDSKLPPEGTRLEPCYAGVSSLPARPPFHCTSSENVLAKIEFEGKHGAVPVIIAPGANHYRLIGLEVTRAPSIGVVYALIGPDKGPANHLIFDRMWIHGTAQSETVRGVMLSHIRYGAVINSYLSDFHCVARTGGCMDSQAIAGGAGDDPMGPFKIVNNFLEAAAESIELGGGAATATPTDIEIRRNHMFKPMIWMRGQAGFVGGVDGNPFIVKNLFELKNAQRVLFEGNILENTWGGFSQAGSAIILGPKNQAKGSENVCPSCQVTDVTIRYVTISHVASGINMANGLSDNKGAAKDGGRYSIHDVVVDDIQEDLYQGFGAFAQISMTTVDAPSPPLHDVSIDHVTAFPSRSIFILGGPRGDRRMSGLSVTNSIFSVGTRTISSTGGGGPQRNCAAQPATRTPENVLHDCFSSYVFEHNLIIEGGGGWPKNNRSLKNAAEVGFSDYRNGKNGNYQLLPSSKFKRTGSDQRDVGADLDAIREATRDVS
ncbi:MAG TPA: hypothetical protein VJP02_23245 [Candidatus Sulfotelmatobacter sp.]|nr:hypothetical protein [Candidatus Sulfotelmatobacter sp.]